MRQPDSSNLDLSPTSLALVRDAEVRLREVGAFDNASGAHREAGGQAAAGRHGEAGRRRAPKPGSGPKKP